MPAILSKHAENLSKLGFARFSIEDKLAAAVKGLKGLPFIATLLADVDAAPERETVVPEKGFRVTTECYMVFILSEDNIQTTAFDEFGQSWELAGPDVSSQLQKLGFVNMFESQPVH